MPQQQRDSDRVRLSLMIDKGIVKKSKAVAILKGVSLSEVVEGLLSGWIVNKGSIEAPRESDEE